MKCLYIQNKFTNIEESIAKAKTTVTDPAIAAMLSGYLIVYISGVYEDCIEHLFIQRARKNNDVELEGFIKSAINVQFRNPRFEKIQNLLGWLNPAYKIEMSKRVEQTNIAAINSIVENKDCIAHGKTFSNATINDISTYYSNAKKIFEVLDDIILRFATTCPCSQP
jgi:hypothetical protein